jgi:hypothetical protein
LTNFFSWKISQNTPQENFVPKNKRNKRQVKILRLSFQWEISFLWGFTRTKFPMTSVLWMNFDQKVVFPGKWGIVTGKLWISAALTFISLLFQYEIWGMFEHFTSVTYELSQPLLFTPQMSTSMEVMKMFSHCVVLNLTCCTQEGDERTDVYLKFQQWTLR